MISSKLMTGVRRPRGCVFSCSQYLVMIAEVLYVPCTVRCRRGCSGMAGTRVRGRGVCSIAGLRVSRRVSPAMPVAAVSIAHHTEYTSALWSVVCADENQSPDTWHSPQDRRRIGDRHQLIDWTRSNAIGPELDHEMCNGRNGNGRRYGPYQITSCGPLGV
jgi:hypothetical protein